MEEEEEVLTLRKVSMKEVLAYYSPKWMAFSGFISSIIVAFSLPFFGFLLSRMIFALMGRSNNTLTSSEFVD